ncbi:hypothetical protein NMG60_11028553 [Bertholletia excelsa]
MFTPQKVWPGWSLTPRSDKNGSGTGANTNSNHRNGETAAKGKSIAFVESTPPPSVGTLAENGGTNTALDCEAMVEKISKLETELFEYQYNMGLLLMEKKEWSTKYEELKQALDDAKGTLKREQAAHLIAISEIEKREENLRKALGVEKQCVHDLEKALHEMRSEYAEIKYTADSKLAEANALVTSIEEKSLEVEAKVHAADAKLAEVSRKSSEIERKSREVEVRENAIRRERLSFNAEREAQESSLLKQREDLREWERKLKEEEDRLAEVRRLLNQREERANEKDAIFKHKHDELDEVQKKIDAANSTLNKKEDDICRRLSDLAVKEKEADSLSSSLEMKEKELLVLKEKLDEREKVEIQKLLDEHKTILDAKKQEFETELEERRKKFDEELKKKAVEVDKKEAQVNHMEEKVAKREQAYEKKMDKFKEKEKDLESKLKAQREREKTIKAEEKNLENEKKQMLVDKENLLSLKADLEKIRTEIEEQQLKISEEREQLKVTEEERTEYQSELILKEGEELRHEKGKFEKEWEELDEKRAEIKRELEEVTEQKEKFAKLKRSEEERLENEKRATHDYVQRELEALKLAKESFTASMEHEKSVMAEKIQSEKSQMLHDFELQKRELESALQKRQEEMENSLSKKEKSFEEEREKELNNINYLGEVARREMEEMKVERQRLERETREVAANKKHVEEQQLEMRRDIDELVGLSRKLKDQREQFIKERRRFIEFVEKHKNCMTCGEITSEFLVSDLQCLPGMDNVEELPLPRLADDYLKDEMTPGVVHSGSPASGGTMSWLRKCTSKIFGFSPGKRGELTGPHSLTESPVSGKLINIEEPVRLFNTEDEPESLGIAMDSLDVQRTQSGYSVREVEAAEELSADNQSNVNGKEQEIQEESQHSDLNGARGKPIKRGRTRIKRHRTVKAVIEDAKSILGDGIEQNGKAADSACMDGQQESDLADKGKPRNTRKRTRAHTSQTTISEQDVDHSEAHSDSVTASGRKRRQKVAPAGETHHEVRYNLRRHKKPVNLAANGALPDPSKGTRDVISNSKDVAAPSVEVASENGGSTNYQQFENAEDGNGNATSKLVNDMVLSEEVNGTPERRTLEYGHDECGSEAHREEEKDEDEDDIEEESQHPGEASIGKKLWTFLTT